MDYFNNIEPVINNSTKVDVYNLLAFKGDSTTWAQANLSYSQRKKVHQKYVNAVVFIYNKYEGGHWRQVHRNSKGLYFYGYGGSTPIYFSIEKLPHNMR